MGGGKQGKHAYAGQRPELLRTKHGRNDLMGDRDPVRSAQPPRDLAFCPLCPKMVHNGHELTRNTTNCNKATTISDGSLVHSLSSFHKPFPKSASCQERSPIELPHLPHPSPPPCAPSTYFQGTHGRNPPLCAIPCPLVIIIIIVSFVRFNREPHRLSFS